MKESNKDRKIYKIALLVSLACILQISESLIPHPIPGLRLGLANMLTLTALVVLGFGYALEVAVLRTILSSFIIGTFMSPTFILSFTGAVISTFVMGFFYWLSRLHQRYRLSIIGISILGAFTHNMVQLYLAYLLLVKHHGIFVFFPWLAYGAVGTGWLVGVVTAGVCRRLTERPKQETPVKIKPDTPVPASNDYVPGTSLLHRSPAEVKIGAIFVLAIAVLALSDFQLYLALFFFLAVLALVSRTPFTFLFSKARRYSSLLAIAFLLPVFFNSGTHVLATVPFTITFEGLSTGGLFACRIFFLIMTSSLLVRTTSPQEMTRGLAQLLSPVRYLGISENRIATILSLSWAAIPHLWETARSTIRAANFNKAKNLRNVIPLLSSLIATLYLETEQENYLWNTATPGGGKHVLESSVLGCKKEQTTFRYKVALLLFFLLFMTCTLGSKSIGWDEPSGPLDFKTTQEVQPTARAEVIVIGAGFAGLNAADRLVEEGVDVILLEKEDRVGGKLLSVPLGGTYANLGAQYFFYGSNSRMNDYVDQAPKFWPEGDMGMLWEGQFVTGANEISLLRKLPLSQSAKRDLLLAQAMMEADHKLIAKRREFIFDKEPMSQRWMTVEGQSAAQYLSRFHPDVTRFYDMFINPEAGGEGAANASALLLVGWYAGFSETESIERYLIPGGNQRMAEFIKEGFLQAGGRLFLSSEVVEVTDAGDKVHVWSKDGRLFESDYAVVATPAHVTKGIVQGLTSAKLQALEEVRYGPIAEIALHLACLPTGERLAGVFIEGDDFYGWIDQTMPSGGNSETETVISAGIVGDEVLSLDDQELLQRVAAGIRRVDPEFDPNTCILDYAIKRWSHGIVSYTPGFLSQYQEALREPQGRIHFAGDYTHDPSLDGAAWSGVRAAEQILVVLPVSGGDGGGGGCFIDTAAYGFRRAN